jgi:hypothetical protein
MERSNTQDHQENLSSSTESVQPNSYTGFVENMATLSKEIQRIAARLQVLQELAASLTKIAPEIQKVAGKISTLAGDIKSLSEVGKSIQSLSAQAMKEKSIVVSSQFPKPKPKPKDRCFAALARNYGITDRKYIYGNIMTLVVGPALQFHGRIFGGFVRDLLVPHTKLGISLDDLDFKDVDIWFESQMWADKFVEHLGDRLKPWGSDTPNNFCPQFYPASRQQYMIHTGNGAVQFPDKELCLVDVVVNDIIPVNDFSVNCLTAGYSYPKNDIDFVAESMFGQWEFTAEQLIEQIKTRSIQVSNFYMIKCIKSHQTTQTTQHEKNFQTLAKLRYERLVAEGYTIKASDGLPFVLPT